MLLIASERFEEHVTPPGHPERMERAGVHGPRRPVGQSRRSGSSRGRQPVRSWPESTTTPTSTTSLRSRAGQSASTPIRRRRPNRWKSRRWPLARCRPPTRADARRDRVRWCGRRATMRSVIGQWVSASTTTSRYRRRGSGKRHRTCRDRGHRRAPRQRVAVDVLRRSGVLYVSSHQFPFYPGTGAAHETGSGAGRAARPNVPLEAGATDADYQLVHCDRPAGARTVPAGVDPHIRRLRRSTKDPLASMRMSTEGFGAIVAGLARVARHHGSMALVTEGGYDLTASRRASMRRSGRGVDYPSRRPGLVGARGQRAVAAVRAAQHGFWRFEDGSSA